MTEKRQQGFPQQPAQIGWARSMREVPDMLVAAQLSLHPLARGEATPTSAEAKRIAGETCDLLRVALANVVEVTRYLPDLGLGSAGQDTIDVRSDPHRDARMSQGANDSSIHVPGERSAEQCALTKPLARPWSAPPQVATRLTDDQLDRLRRCANGNTLRFESSEIVAALVAGGYATEGVGRVVKVTAKGHRYLAYEERRRAAVRA